jgi:hypothetical protein
VMREREREREGEGGEGIDFRALRVCRETIALCSVSFCVCDAIAMGLGR